MISRLVEDPTRQSVFTRWRLAWRRSSHPSVYAPVRTMTVVL